jgi:hypothetical protein
MKKWPTQWAHKSHLFFGIGNWHEEAYTMPYLGGAGISIIQLLFIALKLHNCPSQPMDAQHDSFQLKLIG